MTTAEAREHIEQDSEDAGIMCLVVRLRGNHRVLIAPSGAFQVQQLEPGDAWYPLDDSELATQVMEALKPALALLGFVVDLRDAR